MTSGVGVDDASPTRELCVAGTSPTAREVAGAYDAAATATTRGDGGDATRDATTTTTILPTTTLPTNRVGALVRALGAHVSATETDILNKCEELVDPRGVGWFALAEARGRLSRARSCEREREREWTRTHE